MASSLEVRSPLLDQKVIEFAAGLPPDLKLHQGTSKYLLKRYAEQRVPATAIHRPKMGFSIPLAAWLRVAGSGTWPRTFCSRSGRGAAATSSPRAFAPCGRSTRRAGGTTRINCGP